jgi:hypothetical protein
MPTSTHSFVKNHPQGTTDKIAVFREVLPSSPSKSKRNRLAAARDDNMAGIIKNKLYLHTDLNKRKGFLASRRSMLKKTR